MSNLKDFIKSNSTSDGSNLPSLSTTITKNLMKYDSSISSSDAKKFGEEVAALAYSDEVISSLSKDIGKPLDNESEDEFVARAKSTLTKILKKRLSK